MLLLDLDTIVPDNQFGLWCALLCPIELIDTLGPWPSLVLDLDLDLDLDVDRDVDEYILDCKGDDIFGDGTVGTLVVDNDFLCCSGGCGGNWNDEFGWMKGDLDGESEGDVSPRTLAWEGTGAAADAGGAGTSAANDVCNELGLRDTGLNIDGGTVGNDDVEVDDNLLLWK